LPRVAEEEDRKELGRFLQIARGSASELEYQLLLARDLGFLKTTIFELLSTQLEEVQKVLTWLRDKVIYISPAHDSALATHP
jgi:four helix bundle protein